jgi:hypothetical protein
MNDDLVIKLVRSAAVLLGGATVVFLAFAIPLMIEDMVTAIMLIFVPRLLMHAITLIRLGITGRSPSLDRMRANLAARQAHIRQYHDGAVQ